MAINTSFSIPYGQEKGPSPSGALWSQALLRGQERASREREDAQILKVREAAQRAQEVERLHRMRVLDTTAQMEQLQFQAAAKAAADRSEAIREIESDVHVFGDTYGEAFMRRAHRILPPKEYGEYMAKIRETTPEVLPRVMEFTGPSGKKREMIVSPKTGGMQPLAVGEEVNETDKAYKQSQIDLNKAREANLKSPKATESKLSQEDAAAMKAEMDAIVKGELEGDALLSAIERIRAKYESRRKGVPDPSLKRFPWNPDKGGLD